MLCNEQSCRILYLTTFICRNRNLKRSIAEIYYLLGLWFKFSHYRFFRLWFICLFSHFCFFNIMASLLMKYSEMKNSRSSSTFNKYYTWILKFLQSKSLLIKPGKIPEKRAFQHWVPQMLWRVSSLVININIDLLASQSLTELWKLWDAYTSPKSFILVRYAMSMC